MANAVAWAGLRPADETSATERLLDAASRCIQRHGVARATLEDIATEAGVSRPTVYRYFHDRNAIVSASLVRAARQFIERVRSFVESISEPERVIGETLVYLIREIPRDPILGRMVAGGGAESFVLSTFASAESVAAARYTLEPLAEQFPSLTEHELSEIAELMLRVTLAFLLAPGPARTDAQLRSFLQRRVAPALRLPTRPARIRKAKKHGRS